MDILTKIKKLESEGYIVDIIAMNQYENCVKHVEEGIMPIVTYTFEVMNLDLSDIIYQESFNSFSEALEEGVKNFEKYLKDNKED